MPIPRRVAIYARVSKAQGQDTENQLAQLRAFCAASGWEIVHGYIDHLTGKHSDRERFKAMFTAASRREFDFVVTWASTACRARAWPRLSSTSRCCGATVSVRQL
jgi:DNA invertase Pin-like site-specific DNA recombinase